MFFGPVGFSCCTTSNGHWETPPYFPSGIQFFFIHDLHKRTKSRTRMHLGLPRSRPRPLFEGITPCTNRKPWSFTDQPAQVLFLLLRSATVPSICLNSKRKKKKKKVSWRLNSRGAADGWGKKLRNKLWVWGSRGRKKKPKQTARAASLSLFISPKEQLYALKLKTWLLVIIMTSIPREEKSTKRRGK